EWRQTPNHVKDKQIRKQDAIFVRQEMVIESGGSSEIESHRNTQQGGDQVDHKEQVSGSAPDHVGRLRKPVEPKERRKIKNQIHDLAESEQDPDDGAAG